MGSHKGFGCSSFLPFPHKMPLIGMLQAASLRGLVGSGRLLQSSGSAWPQVANHWVQVVWLQQNCKVRSGWPLARYQAIHKFVTHSDGHHTWGWCSNPFFLAGGSASCWSNKLLFPSPGSSQWTFLISWFLASMSCPNGSSCDKLAFLFGCLPWRR